MTATHVYVGMDIFYSSVCLLLFYLDAGFSPRSEQRSPSILTADLFGVIPSYIYRSTRSRIVLVPSRPPRNRIYLEALPSSLSLLLRPLCNVIRLTYRPAEQDTREITPQVAYPRLLSPNERRKKARIKLTASEDYTRVDSVKPASSFTRNHLATKGATPSDEPRLGGPTGSLQPAQGERHWGRGKEIRVGLRFARRGAAR